MDRGQVCVFDGDRLARSKRAPRCPSHLGHIAKSEWRRVAGDLVRAGLLTTLDLRLLEAYCMTWQALSIAMQKVQEHGAVMETDEGSEISPWQTIAFQAMEELRLTAAELGMTPAARASMGVTWPDADKHG